MPVIFEKDAPDHACPFRDFQPCLGAKCMAWSWYGRTEDRCETNNLVETEEGQRPVGSPKVPEGEGWQMDGPARHTGYHRSAKDKLPPALTQYWVRPLEQVRGGCNRTGHDQGYPW